MSIKVDPQKVAELPRERNDSVILSKKRSGMSTNPFYDLFNNKRLILMIIVFVILLSGCSDKNSPGNYGQDELASIAIGCFKALDAEVSDAPIPYFPYISLQPDKLAEGDHMVRAPLEYVLYRYWTNEKLDKEFEKLASFRTNPIWTSNTMDLAAIIPVFSDESRRLFYKGSGHIETRWS